ncbi:hypothetical protein Vretimale_3186 [Volvox reticuliferus]|uniref:Peptidase M11 gametolysin domain-containing protein n=1 Tax=Volvox reticuliferus TaxID=1737510 RepID=A0A8J4DDS9_9CHLO|nr:hypothetical protein Vretimale_3186 [Volvox reticuliferus]
MAERPAGCLLLLAAILLVTMAFAGFSGAAAQDLANNNVNVTVFVEGTVLVYVSHQAPSKSTIRPPDTPDVIYTLADKQQGEETTVAASVRVNFGKKAASLKTGDIVQAPIRLLLTQQQAEELAVDASSSNSSSSERRLLSEAHQQARRMVLDFHNTRRSVQEMQTLLGLLNTLGMTSLDQVVSSDDPLIIKRTVDKDMFITGGVQQNITSLTFVFKSSSCGVHPALNAAKIQQWWFDNGDDAPIVGSLQRYYNSCTYNQLTFKKQDNLVFDVDIPCTGATRYGKYNLKTGSKSGDNELYGLAELAKQYIKNTSSALLKQWPSYRRKILIFPFDWYTSWSGFAGMAMVGCAPDQDCLTWINPGISDDRPDMPVIFQELGHNIGLVHSARIVCEGSKCWKDEYGDPTDPMGSTWANNPQKQVVCTNAPQSYKAGWSATIPGGHLRAFSDLTPGAPRVFNLPAMSLNKTNMLRIITDERNPNIGDKSEQPQRALFVSYRVRQSNPGTYDSGLNEAFNNRVWVHEYNETANEIPGNLDNPPLVLTMLTDEKTPNIGGWGSVNRSFTQLLSPGLGGINITVRSKTPQAATVSVCRFLKPTEAPGGQSCSDGLDNDCDGLVDAQDPDCAVIPPPPPPSPIQPPPPLLRQAPPLPARQTSPPPPRRTPPPRHRPGGKRKPSPKHK